MAGIDVAAVVLGRAGEVCLIYLALGGLFAGVGYLIDDGRYRTAARLLAVGSVVTFAVVAAATALWLVAALVGVGGLLQPLVSVPLRLAPLLPVPVGLLYYVRERRTTDG